MNILGYVAYAILIFLTVTWALGIRTTPSAAYSTILGGLCFLMAAIIVPVFSISFIHCIWIIPFIYVLMLVTKFLFANQVPVITPVLIMVGSIYGGILRIGLDPVETQRKRKREWLEYFARK